MSAQEAPAALRRLPWDQVRRRRIAVVGGGIIGTATAYAAASIGGEAVEVHLYERSRIGHEAGASIDGTRGLRHIYGPHEHHTRWAMEALGLWRDLEWRAERPIFDPSGNAWIVHQGASTVTSAALERTISSTSTLEFVRASRAILQRLGIPHEWLDGDAFRARFPQFADPNIQVALLDLAGGRLFARDAVLAQRDLALRAGVTVHEHATLVEVRPEAGACGLRFADGSSLEADTVVLAVNGWLRPLLDDLAGHDGRDPSGGWWNTRLLVTEQPLYYLAPAPAEAAAFESDRFPVFIFASSGVYGVPAHDGLVKMGDANPSRLLDSPDGRGLAEPAYRERLLDEVVRQLPGLRDAALVQERTCFFDLSEDGEFVLDQWDAEARLIVACGFSGHGFKVGPVVGARLARYALEGRRPEDLGSFAAARFG